MKNSNFHNHQKKIAVINDLSGFGRCSLTVSLPIISAMGVQCCPLPTSVFSNHTGFPSYYFEDFTPQMTPYMKEWEKLNLHFQGIYTGFLGSEAQIKIVKDFIHAFKKEGTFVLIDPVMGDYGKTYPTYTQALCLKMRELIPYADILTPNVTEACLLTDTVYREDFSMETLCGMAKELSLLGPGKVVITGIAKKSDIANLCYEKGREPVFIKCHKVGTQRSGTGDIFASILAADAVNGVDFSTSVRKASSFIQKCILRSMELEIPTTDGVCFEEVLPVLMRKKGKQDKR